MLLATDPRSLGSRLAAAPAPAARGCGDLDPHTDVELMALAAEGRSHALSELYCRYAQMLLALALRMLRNRSDAEDVLQEVFLYVWRRACAYDSARSSVSTWLVLITRSRSLDRLKRHRRLSERIAENDLEQVIEAESRVAEDSDDGFDRVLGVERRERIRRELRRLPDTQREVLELFYFCGLTQKQIAERMAVPIGTVKTRTLLGVRKLRRALGREIVALT